MRSHTRNRYAFLIVAPAEQRVESAAMTQAGIVRYFFISSRLLKVRKYEATPRPGRKGRRDSRQYSAVRSLSLDYSRISTPMILGLPCEHPSRVSCTCRRLMKALSSMELRSS